jgi:hypothetical protein
MAAGTAGEVKIIPHLLAIIPAKAEIQFLTLRFAGSDGELIAACAGMTRKKQS